MKNKLKNAFEQLVEIQNEDNVTLKEKLRLAGYDSKKVLGSRSYTEYFIHSENDIVIGFAFTTENDTYAKYRKEYPIILEKWLCELIGYASISLVRSKEESELMPCVDYKGRPNIRLSRIACGVEDAGEGIQVDHINRQRLCCTGDNLRICNNAENSQNKDNVSIKPYNGKYYYKLDVTLDQFALLDKDDFVKVGNKPKEGKVVVASPPFDNTIDAKISYGDILRTLNAGTSLEEYIYNIKNDFCRTLNLLIHYYALGDVSEKELYELNLLYWRVDFFEYPIEWFRKLHGIELCA